MCTNLRRVKSIHLKQIQSLSEVEEDLDVDLDWDAIAYVFGNGFVGAPITGDIFMPSEVIGDEEEIKYGGGIRYHTPEAIQKINEKIGHLTEADIRARIIPEKMTQVYRFHPERTDLLVEECLNVIGLFKRAEQNKDVVVAGIR